MKIKLLTNTDKYSVNEQIQSVHPVIVNELKQLVRDGKAVEIPSVFDQKQIKVKRPSKNK